MKLFDEEYKKIKEKLDELNQDLSHFSSRDDICTPMNCVELMVNYIPENFWKKKIKVLEPCCGNGNFGFYVATKTDIENIFLNEVNKKRIKNLTNFKVFKKQQITQKDFLKFDNKETFDLIVANPPYSGGGNKNKSLSNLFIQKGIELLNDGGFLLIIAPNNWMTFNNNNETLKKLLTLGKFYVIDNDAKKFFGGVGSSFTIFLWRKKETAKIKTKVKNNFLIKDETEVELKENMKFIPLYLNQNIIDMTQYLFDYEKENGITYRCDLHDFTQKEKLSKEKNGEFKYKTIHTTSQIRWANIKQDIYDKYKVVFPLSTYPIPYLEHQCNFTQSTAFLVCENKEKAEEILTNINENKYFKVLLFITRYGNFNNIKVLKHIKLNETIKTKDKNIVEKINKILIDKGIK